MSALTEEQRRRIEENRKKALEKLNRAKIQADGRENQFGAQSAPNPQNAKAVRPADKNGHGASMANVDSAEIRNAQKQRHGDSVPKVSVIGAKFMNSATHPNEEKGQFVPPFQRESGSRTTAELTSAVVDVRNVNQPATNVSKRTASLSPVTAISSTSSITAPSSSSTASSSSSVASDETRRLIEEKKKRAQEIRARKNSANVPTSMLSANTLGDPNQAVPSHSTSKPELGDASSALAQKQSSPNDLWSRIPENGVKTIRADVALPVRTNTDEDGNAQKANLSKKESAASSLAAKSAPTLKIKATCALVNKNRFKVMCKYHAKSIELFKSFDGREYDVKNKTWSFPVRSHDRLIGELKACCSDLDAEPLPRFVLRTLEEIRMKEEEFVEDPDLTPIGHTLLNKIYTFQRQGILAGVRNSGRILLADDMGLGKTVQAIGISAYYRKDWPVLVVCPSSVRFQWNEAFAEWLPELVMDLDTQVVIKGTDQVPKVRKVVITTYDLIAKTVKDRKFGVVILDESHYIKNEKTARTKAVIPVCQAAKRVMLLSGTPALSRPKELYTQISAIDPTIFRMFHEYGVRYCDARKNAWGWDYTGSSNLEELQILLEGHLMIRRNKSEVLEQLPPKRRQIVHLDASLVKRETGLKAAKQMLEKAHQMQKKADAQSALLEFFHQTADAKVQAVCQYLSDRMEGLPKFIVFAHHQNVLNAVSSLFSEQGVRFVRIDGSTSGYQRQELAQRFNEDSQCKAAVLSIMAANAGLNMATASCVIFAEIMWNPGIMVQAEDRAHRIGQRDSVLVQYLLAGGTSDDHVWDMLAKKLNVLGQVGLASASDQSFREADKEYQKVKSDQPSIESFLTQVEEDDEFLRSVAANNGVKDFISPVKTASTQHFDSENNNNGVKLNGSQLNGVASSIDATSARSKNSGSRRSSPTKPHPPQRNTLDKYFSPTQRDSTSSSETAHGGEDTNCTWKEEHPRTEEASEEDFLDDFDWLPPDDEEDPFLSQFEPNKRRRLR